jgi:hypothetical protein
MRRTLYAVGGLLAAFVLLSVVGLFTKHAEAQDQTTPVPLSPPSPTRAPVEPPGIPIAGPSALAPDPAPTRTLAAAPEPPRPKTIEQLIDHLNGLRAKKADLEKQERETIAALKERLKEQKEKLQKLGIQLEEPPPPSALEVPLRRPTTGN